MSDVGCGMWDVGFRMSDVLSQDILSETLDHSDETGNQKPETRNFILFTLTDLELQKPETRNQKL
jgi:hypothetical protein